MKRILLAIFICTTLLRAQQVRGTLSTGVYMGTPFWNRANFSEGNVIDAEDSFYRTVNQLKLQGKFGEHFRVVLNTMRNDGFQSENHLAETKIFRFNVQYRFNRGKVMLGRMAPFQRWIRGSIDGLDIRLKTTAQLSFHVIGGQYIPYGKLYDSERGRRLAYADVRYRLSSSAYKIKVYNDEGVTKAGGDLFGRFGKLRFNANYGYDLTHKKLADGSFNLFYPLSSKWFLTGDYRLFRAQSWMLGKEIKFNGYRIERFLMSSRYGLSANYMLNFTQMVTLTETNEDYLTMLTVAGRFFQLGFNYLGSNQNMQRMGMVLGGQYRFFNRLQVYGGVTPVDYLFLNEEEHQQTIAYYFRMHYQIFKSLSVNANLNYYQKNETLHSNLRGGVRIMYYFGSN